MVSMVSDVAGRTLAEGMVEWLPNISCHNMLAEGGSISTHHGVKYIHAFCFDLNT